MDELRDACTGAVATLLPKLRSLSAPVPTSAAGAAASDSGLSALALLARDGDWTLGNATAALPALMQWLGAAAAPGTLLATGNSTAGSAAAVCAMRTPATTAAAAAVEAAGAKLLTAARALLRLAAAAHVRTCVAGAAALPALSIESDEAPEDTASAPLTGLSVKERRRAFAAIATGPRSLSTSPEAGSGDVSAAASREPPSVVWWLTRARSTIAHVLAAAHELTEATRAAYTANCAALAAATAAAEAEAAAAASAAPAAAKTETSALPGIKPAGASATATASAVVTLQVSASTWVEQGPWAALAGATEARAGLEQAAAANAAAEAARGELEQRMSELFEAKRALKDATARGDALQAALASASASAGGVTVTSSPGAATDTNGAAAAGAGGAGTHAAAAAGRSTLATGGEDAVRKTVERLRARETEYQAAVKALQVRESESGSRTKIFYCINELVVKLNNSFYLYFRILTFLTWILSDFSPFVSHPRQFSLRASSSARRSSRACTSAASRVWSRRWPAPVSSSPTAAAAAPAAAAAAAQTGPLGSRGPAAPALSAARASAARPWRQRARRVGSSRWTAAL